jgi:hypothetical protein
VILMKFRNIIKQNNCAGCNYCAEAGELQHPAGKCPHGAGVHEFVNLTPHAIVVQGQEFLPSGEVLRLDNIYGRVGTVGNWFTLSEVSQSLVEEPPVVEGRYYIVSAMVGQACPRADFISPDTNRANRNEQGHIINVPGFVRYK